MGLVDTGNLLNFFVSPTELLDCLSLAAGLWWYMLVGCHEPT